MFDYGIDVENLKQKIDGRSVILSVSGGKDSTAMGLFLLDLGIPFRMVFLDTGWEHKLTYDYIKGPLTDKLGDIEIVKGPLPMADLILKKGMFPSRVTRFCTQELKVKPIIKYLKGLEEEPINAVGIRAAESMRRAKMPAWEWQKGYDCEVWRPILDWTLDQVIEIHKRHDIKPNPLYLLGASRVGCWPCIYARKKEISFISEKDPERIEKIRDLEAEVAENARARYAEKGETFESLGYKRPTFFQSRNGAGEWPIDKVVDWAKTAHGGKQYELFSVDPDDTGCMRWGLCDNSDKP